MEENSKIKSFIVKCSYAVIIILIIAVIALLILKYDVEGEKNMPFKLSSIILISNALGYSDNSESDYLWDCEVYQNNDIYLNIEKNKNYKETEIIKSIKIENIKVKEEPNIGQIKFYRASNDENILFEYNDEYLIQENIEYTGDTESNLKELKISNQGGTIIITAVNATGKRYTSNDEEFIHNGGLLEKVGMSYEDAKSTISFELVISLESGISYRANIELDIPAGNIIQEGSSNKEITDLKNVVFKRE